MMNWNELTDQKQIYMYWGYLENADEEISFQEFDEIMRENPWL